MEAFAVKEVILNCSRKSSCMTTRGVPPIPPPRNFWREMFDDTFFADNFLLIIFADNLFAPPPPPPDLTLDLPLDFTPDQAPLWTDRQSKNITFPHSRIGGNN